MYEHYGITEYYRSVTLIFIRNSVSNMIFVSRLKPIRGLLPLASTKSQHSIYDFLNSGLLSALSSTLIYPMNVLKNIQQSEFGDCHDRLRQLLRLVYKQRGNSIQEFYIGTKCNFL